MRSLSLPSVVTLKCPSDPVSTTSASVFPSNILSAAKPVNALPSPTKLVADNAPDDELNVRLVPVFGGKFPEAAVVNKT